MPLRKTPEQKKLSATQRNDRDARVINLKKQPPKPPRKLDRAGKRVYNEICAHLAQAGELRDVDRHTISNLIYWMQLQDEARSLIDQEQENGGDGLVITHKTGHRQISPELTLLKEAQAQVDKLSASLGMTPKSRAQIQAFAAKAGASSDSFGDFLKKRTS